MNLIDLVFPKTCLECGAGGGYMCNKCLAKLGKVEQVCPKCTKPSVDGMTHTRCVTPFSINGLFVLFAYRGVLRKALLKTKYNFAEDIGGKLSEICCSKIKSHAIVVKKDATLLPVPLHRKRKNWRGFNQSEAVGKLIAKEMKWEFTPNLVFRKKYKKPQTELVKEERKQNIKGVFSINKDLLGKADKERQIIIFDDVWTTGATIREIGKVLKRNGFKSVWGMTVAH